MFALRDYRWGMAGDAKGEAPGAWTPKRVGDPTEGVGAWTVAKATATAVSPFAPSHTDENRWSKTRGQDRSKKGMGGEGQNSAGKPGETTVTRTKRTYGDERTRRYGPQQR